MDHGSPDISIALALGGGGARGLAHIHALAAFDELGIRPSIIAGTSIGAIAAAAYAGGMSAAEIRAYAEQRLMDRWSLFTDLVRRQNAPKSAPLPGSLRRSRRFDLQRMLATLLPNDFPAGFADLAIPVKVVATDFFAQAETVFDSGPLLPALAASAAVPVLFRPVLYDGRVYIDGGTTNPIPFDLLHGKADIVIAVDIIGDNIERTANPVSRVDVLTASSHIMQRAIVNAKRRVCEPDLMVRPEIDGVRVHEFHRIGNILDRSGEFRDHLKRQIGGLLEMRGRR